MCIGRYCSSLEWEALNAQWRGVHWNLNILAMGKFETDLPWP